MNGSLLRNTSRALAAAVALVAGCGPVTRPDGGKGLLPVGSKAPELWGIDAKGQSLRLSQVRGKVTVVYFYPKDETPGCTKQACAFRDQFARFTAADVPVFGVSRDSEASHNAFRAHHDLPFALVADPKGEAQSAYGVPSKLPGIAARVTFLVDRDGAIARVWPEVDPVLNVSEVLAAAQQLEAKQP